VTMNIRHMGSKISHMQSSLQKLEIMLEDPVANAMHGNVGKGGRKSTHGAQRVRRMDTLKDRMKEFDLDIEREDKHRVGVPGGVVLNLKSFSSIFRFSGTSFEATVRCKWFWPHLILYGMMCATFNISVPSKVFENHRSALGSLLAFALVFFNSQVYSQYTQRWHDICKTNGAVTTVYVNAASLLDEERALRLSRYCISQLHVFYNMMNLRERAAHWNYMVHVNLVTSEEREYLAGIGGGSAGNILCQWCVNILHGAYRDGTITEHEANFIKTNVHTARGLAAKQIAYSLWPVPLIYMHAAAIMVHVYMFQFSWNSAVDFVLARNQSDFQAAYEFLSHLFYMSMLIGFWWCGIIMAQPMGHDATDYDVMVELRGLWRDAKIELCAAKDPDSPFNQAFPHQSEESPAQEETPSTTAGEADQTAKDPISSFSQAFPYQSEEPLAQGASSSTAREADHAAKAPDSPFNQAFPHQSEESLAQEASSSRYSVGWSL